MFRGGVQLDANAVHTTHDRVIEGIFQRTLIDIVLVLTDPDGFRIDFHQLRQRIHQATPDRNRTTHGDVFVGKFFACGIGCGVD